MAKQPARTEKRAKFHHTFFHDGAVKYKAGEHYPLTEETLREIAKGHASVVEAAADDLVNETKKPGDPDDSGLFDGE